MVVVVSETEAGSTVTAPKLLPNNVEIYPPLLLLARAVDREVAAVAACKRQVCPVRKV